MRFSTEPVVVNLSEFLKDSSFLMNKDHSTNNSIGWNTYGGAGAKFGIAQAGYTYSKVKQDGESSVTNGFYDMRDCTIGNLNLRDE